MSFLPKKVLLSKLYEKQIEMEKKNFARETKTPPPSLPLPLPSMQECTKEDCSFCKKKKDKKYDNIFQNLQALE